MKLFVQKLYTFSFGIIQYICLFLTGLLFLGAQLLTCFSTDMSSQIVLTRWDNPLWNILGTVLFAGYLILITNFICKRNCQDRMAVNPRTVLTVIVILWCLLIGGLLILFGKTAPTADAMSVYSAAIEFANGNTGVIHPTDSYLSYYPHQVGLMLFFEILIRFWKLLPVSFHAYHFIKCLYVLLACAAIYFQKGIVRLLWKDERAEYIYLLLAGANLPLLMYTSFVYGEIPSFTAISAGLFFLLKLLNNPPAHKKAYGLASILFLAASVMLRENSLIFIIAVLIVTVLQSLFDRKKELLIFALLCFLCCFNILPMVQKSYELRSGNYLSSGVPAISYFAMGMQEASRANGWYNAFNFNTYYDTGLNTEETVRISRQAIRDRLAYFQEHPGYAVDFYVRKHLSQWADGTYASRQATLITFGGRSSFFTSLYEGDYSHIFINYCNIYQNVLYLGAFIFCIAACRKSSRNSLPEYLGLICVVGGFLFHIMWEANSRYILLYGLMLMPYCARGISLLLTLRNTQPLSSPP